MKNFTMKNWLMAFAVVAGASIFAMGNSADAGCGYNYGPSFGGGFGGPSYYSRGYTRSFSRYNYAPRGFNHYGYHSHHSFNNGFNSRFRSQSFYRGNRGPSFGVQTRGFGLYIR